MNLGLTIALLVTPIMAAWFTWRTPLNLFAGVSVLVALVFFLATRGQTLQASGDSSGRAYNSGRECGWGLFHSECAARPGVHRIFSDVVPHLRDDHVAARISKSRPGLLAERSWNSIDASGVGHDTRNLYFGMAGRPRRSLGDWHDRRGSLRGRPGRVYCVPGIPLSGVFAGVCFLAFGICLLVVPLTSILSSLVPARITGKRLGWCIPPDTRDRLCPLISADICLPLPVAIPGRLDCLSVRWWSVCFLCWRCTDTMPRRKPSRLAALGAASA